jgi:hypothetical protein
VSGSFVPLFDECGRLGHFSAHPMRSQKQNNRSPRPFKNRQDQDRWSGVQKGGFIPSPKSAPQVKKAATDAAAEKGGRS